jgi:hypothetical protein
MSIPRKEIPPFLIRTSIGSSWRLETCVPLPSPRLCPPNFRSTIIGILVVLPRFYYRGNLGALGGHDLSWTEVLVIDSAKTAPSFKSNKGNLNCSAIDRALNHTRDGSAGRPSRRVQVASRSSTERWRKGHDNRTTRRRINWHDDRTGVCLGL